MKVIELPCYGVVVEIEDGVGTITSNLGAGLDVLESLVLAHACAGVDITAPEYVEGFEVAVDKILNNSY